MGCFSKKNSSIKYRDSSLFCQKYLEMIGVFFRFAIYQEKGLSAYVYIT